MHFVILAISLLFGLTAPCFAASDGATDPYQKISDTEDDFTAVLDDGDSVGGSNAELGDLNSDGVIDLAVGVAGDGDGGTDRGAVYILFWHGDKDSQGESGLAGYAILALV